MRKNRFASISVAAATTLLTLGGAGCGELRDLAEDILSHGGGSPDASTGGSCSYQGKPYDLGSSFPSADGCNVCSCEKGGSVVCTEKGCPPPTPPASCEKIPVTAADGSCVRYETWKLRSIDFCTTRGETLNDLVFSDICEDGVSTRQAIYVCCKSTPANDPCVESKRADGTPCRVCTDATGMVVKTDCGDGK